MNTTRTSLAMERHSGAMQALPALSARRTLVAALGAGPGAIAARLRAVGAARAQNRRLRIAVEELRYFSDHTLSDIGLVRGSILPALRDHV